MKARIVVLAAALLCLAIPEARAGLPLMSDPAMTHSQQVTASVWAGVCYAGGDWYRCRTISFTEGTAWDGSKVTRLDYQIQVNSSSSWGYRYLSCVLDSRSLTVRPGGATFDAEIADPSVCESNFGMQCPYEAETCNEWPFVEPVVVKGEMASPGFEQTYVRMQSLQDNDYGYSSREQCRGGSGGSLHDGGVYFSLPDGRLLYFPFGYAGDYGQASGSYQYDSCNRIGG